MIGCIIPAYKPSKEGLIEFVARLLDECPELEPVVVNDGSPAEFDDVFNALVDRVIVITHPQNLGKGRALKTAMSYIENNMPHINGIVTADADGQHRVEDVQAVCREHKRYPNALILGKRDFDGDNVPPRSKFGNTLTRNVFAIASGTKISDTQTGLRAFSRDKIDLFLKIKGERYEYEMNVLLYSAREGVSIREIPIATVYIDSNESSHFNPIRDSLRVYMCIMKFAFSSLTAFIVDYVLLLVSFPIFTGWLNDPVFALFVSEVFARVISSLINFVINKYFVFRSRESTRRAFTKYFMLAVCVLMMDYVLMNAFVNVLGIHAAISKIIAGGTLFFVNMLVQGRMVFKKQTEGDD